MHYLKIFFLNMQIRRDFLLQVSIATTVCETTSPLSMQRGTLCIKRVHLFMHSSHWVFF